MIWWQLLPHSNVDFLRAMLFSSSLSISKQIEQKNILYLIEKKSDSFRQCPALVWKQWLTVRIRVWWNFSCGSWSVDWMLGSSNWFAEDFLIWSYDVPTFGIWWITLRICSFSYSNISNVSIQPLSVQKISAQSWWSFLGFTSLLLAFLDIRLSLWKHSMNGCSSFILLMKDHLEENGWSTPALCHSSATP